MYGGWTEIIVLVGFIWDIYIRSKITEYKRKVDVQNYPFGWVRFENRFLNY